VRARRRGVARASTIDSGIDHAQSLPLKTTCTANHRAPIRSFLIDSGPRTPNFGRPCEKKFRPVSARVACASQTKIRYALMTIARVFVRLSRAREMQLSLILSIFLQQRVFARDNVVNL
jgi:hypothetical protein